MKKKNKGSTIIEVTLLMPIFLGCIYFYIMLFMFLMDSGKRMERMTENMYVEKKDSEEDIFVRTEGKVKIYWIEETGKLFDIHMELRKQENNEVENIRRWQLVTDLF